MPCVRARPEPSLGDGHHAFEAQGVLRGSKVLAESMLPRVVAVDDEAVVWGEVIEVASLASLDEPLERPKEVVDHLEPRGFRRSARRDRRGPVDLLAPLALEPVLRRFDGTL